MADCYSRIQVISKAQVFAVANACGLNSTSIMTIEQIGELLKALGIPPEKTAEMASQLDKRAKQLAEMKGRTYEEALIHLLNLMRQGIQGTPDS
jgi:hypothetical protein